MSVTAAPDAVRSIAAQIEATLPAIEARITRELAAPDPDTVFQRTYSGGRYFARAPRMCDVDLLDIAHHLSMQTRFAGATRVYYSVAEHSVHLSRIVPAAYALHALLHDGPEFCLTDLPRPVKLDNPAYARLEALNAEVVLGRFALPAEMPAPVARLDHAMNLAEDRALFRAPICTREVIPAEITQIPEIAIQGWDWRTARDAFLARFEEITGLSPADFRGRSERVV
ncbi:hypothetical protein CKO28_00255 [Rhodovibrio sodomensis]|uniref:Phosphohydrolase n=1 Tax=Rhodovibrio sodomensis TaxID=1088 RepID=A0ABS1D9A5_9PROT|nr:hypothetical protein [Rhodovibrio sodomensis]MBK1666471.1 hypothetical protein [Rhodovibrio sodomensis]